MVDIFTCALDQTGLLEQSGLLKRGGGVTVLEDSFAGEVFQESFRRVFERHAGPNDAAELDMAFNASIEVICSKELKVMGMVGPGVSANKKSASISETAVGVGGTTQWKLSAADHRTSPAFFFEGSQKCFIPNAVTTHTLFALQVKVRTMGRVVAHSFVSLL